MAWRAAIASAAALITAFGVAASGQQGGPGDDALVLTHGDWRGSGDIRFELQAQPVSHLYPGAVRSLRLTVVNDHGLPLQIRDLSGRLAGTSRHGCAATSANLEVREYSGALPITIKPYSRRTLPGTIAVAMPRSATPKCSGTRFWITVSGLGQAVRR